jgi:hypothetical protein
MDRLEQDWLEFGRLVEHIERTWKDRMRQQSGLPEDQLVLIDEAMNAIKRYMASRAPTADNIMELNRRFHIIVDGLLTIALYSEFDAIEMSTVTR